ncbi:hypothetical protein LTR10_021641 [Elasticomyces elasticus]|uniref:NmrA-like domain-containing protein n=1 Tax=Exophiala sideris TaxID=1016849 RepID=A0ABR0J2P2_9EURO|nr:hypothetical protein LTR10_021641 [Elasticomyces elasticus]KAK5024114.1 hypothetical protein LTS07_008849 [Exophiala sideris]KAK5029025.1 hypothetical protein LTR13_008895 [Exophiala sideris]KAK5054826.1 hypothetical protein LTR69_008734 [Exophiala sideris]KAK5178848.1 hypothetical protein LTR44_008676 [Eurotiomycetes sp. CCFEE 6388]
MSNLKRILITGATGKQGGALLSDLLKSPPKPPFHLVALTRNANSPKAQALARETNVSVLQGDLNDCEAIFKSSPEPFHGVFSVQVPLRPKVEEQQGKALVDAAVTNGVRHFVYTSADRGGPERSDVDKTAVKHFASKFNIENHLKNVSKNTKGEMQWTIIRPVALMENLTPDFLGKAFATIWQLNGMDSKLQLVSAADIGILAADMFKNPGPYSGRAISFATDELTAQEANNVFSKVMGTEMPTTYPVLGRLIKSLLHEQLGVMFDWFKTDGFGANPNEFRDKFPEMQDFEKWLRQSSGFKKQTA